MSLTQKVKKFSQNSFEKVVWGWVIHQALNKFFPDSLEKQALGEETWSWGTQKAFNEGSQDPLKVTLWGEKLGWDT